MIQSVDRAARILKALSAGAPGRLGVSELATRLGLAKGTVHGLLRSLQAHGLVEQDADTGKYQLGPALLELSSGYLDINELRTRSLAWSELLAVRTTESVRVGVPHDGGILVVHHVFRPDSSLQILEVGAVLPLHASALGKAVLAYLPQDAVEATLAADLPKLTAHTLTTTAELGRELDVVRRRRFALEDEEAVLGEAAIAAPIFERGGTVIGAIGIAGPVDRLLDADRCPSLSNSVTEAARSISRDLGSSIWPVVAAS
jgi:DNA-binding IclR family transcriptional regulator